MPPRNEQGSRPAGLTIRFVEQIDWCIQLHDASLVQHNNSVILNNCVQSVRYCDHSRLCIRASALSEIDVLYEQLGSKKMKIFLGEGVINGPAAEQQQNA